MQTCLQYIYPRVPSKFLRTRKRCNERLTSCRCTSRSWFSLGVNVDFTWRRTKQCGIVRTIVASLSVMWHQDFFLSQLCLEQDLKSCLISVPTVSYFAAEMQKALWPHSGSAAWSLCWNLFSSSNDSPLCFEKRIWKTQVETKTCVTSQNEEHGTNCVRWTGQQILLFKQWQSGSLYWRPLRPNSLPDGEWGPVLGNLLHQGQRPLRSQHKAKSFVGGISVSAAANNMETRNLEQAWCLPWWHFLSLSVSLTGSRTYHSSEVHPLTHGWKTRQVRWERSREKKHKSRTCQLSGQMRNIRKCAESLRHCRTPR